MSFVLFLIGAGGIAGAIETGKGIIPALIVFTIGATGLLYQAMKYQKGEDYKHNVKRNNSNCHQRPYYLGDERRRA